VTDDLEEARSWARHGYEIGQKHCSWSDYGVAPAWLTEGWPPHIGSCEFLKEAARYDETLTRVRAALRNPDAYEDAADVIRAVRDALQGTSVQG
jgi:hypothetical protein